MNKDVYIKGKERLGLLSQTATCNSVHKFMHRECIHAGLPVRMTYSDLQQEVHNNKGGGERERERERERESTMVLRVRSRLLYRWSLL